MALQQTLRSIETEVTKLIKSEIQIIYDNK